MLKRGRRIAALLVMGAAVAIACGTACGSFAGDDGAVAEVPDGASAETSTIESGAAEAGAAPDAALPEAGVDTGVTRHLRVFVLANKWSLNSHPGKDGGIWGGRDAADLFCADEASAAALGSSFFAWMSTSTSDAVDRLPKDADWSLPVAGKAPMLVFPSAAAIDMGQGPIVPIDRGADGVVLTDGDNRVWTGTSVLGRTTGDHCSNWSTFASGTAGRTNTTSDAWTNAGTAGCNEYLHIFCFEH